MTTHPPADIPAPVCRFLADCIDSVSLLDALLTIHASPGRSWTAAELGRARVSSEPLAAAQLEKLRGCGLLRAGDGGFVYAPAAEQAQMVDALADCYARRRHTVIGLIYRSTA